MKLRGTAASFQCVQSELDYDTVKMILSEYKISNADITLRYDATSDDLIDVIEGNRVYVPCIYLLNKIGKFNIRVDLLFYHNRSDYSEGKESFYEMSISSCRSNKYRRIGYYL